MVSGVQESRNDTVFKKPKSAASASLSGAKRTAKAPKAVTKTQPEEENDILDDELLGGDSLFADSAVDARKRIESSESGSDSEEENVDEAKLRQGKAYLQKIMRRGAGEHSDSESGSEMDVDEATARLAEEAVRISEFPLEPSIDIAIILTMPF